MSDSDNTSEESIDSSFIESIVPTQQIANLENDRKEKINIPHRLRIKKSITLHRNNAVDMSGKLTANISTLSLSTNGTQLHSMLVEQNLTCDICNVPVIQSLSGHIKHRFQTNENIPLVTSHGDNDQVTTFYKKPLFSYKSNIKEAGDAAFGLFKPSHINKWFKLNLSKLIKLKTKTTDEEILKKYTQGSGVDIMANNEVVCNIVREAQSSDFPFTIDHFNMPKGDRESTRDLYASPGDSSKSGEHCCGNMCHCCKLACRLFGCRYKSKFGGGGCCPAFPERTISLNVLERAHLQNLYNTPCSSIQFSLCNCDIQDALVKEHTTAAHYFAHKGLRQVDPCGRSGRSYCSSVSSHTSMQYRSQRSYAAVSLKSGNRNRQDYYDDDDCCCKCCNMPMVSIDCQTESRHHLQHLVQTEPQRGRCRPCCKCCRCSGKGGKCHAGCQHFQMDNARGGTSERDGYSKKADGGRDTKGGSTKGAALNRKGSPPCCNKCTGGAYAYGQPSKMREAGDKRISDTQYRDDQKFTETKDRDGKIGFGTQGRDENFPVTQYRDEKRISETQSRDGKRISDTQSRDGKRISDTQSRDGKRISDTQSRDGKVFPASPYRDEKRISETQSRDGKRISDTQSRDGKRISDTQSRDGKRISDTQSRDGKVFPASPYRDEKRISETQSRDGKVFPATQYRDEKRISETQSRDGKRISETQSRDGKRISETQSRDEKRISETQSRDGKVFPATQGRDEKRISDTQSPDGKVFPATQYRDEKRISETQDRDGRKLTGTQFRDENKVPATQYRDEKRISETQSRDKEKFPAAKGRDAKKFSGTPSRDEEKFPAAKSRDAKKFSGTQSRDEEKFPAAQSRDAGKFPEEQYRGEKKLSGEQYRGEKKLSGEQYRDEKKLPEEQYRGEKKLSGEQYRGEKKLSGEQYRDEKKLPATEYRDKEILLAAQSRDEEKGPETQSRDAKKLSETQYLDESQIPEMQNRDDTQIRGESAETIHNIKKTSIKPMRANVKLFSMDDGGPLRISMRRVQRRNKKTDRARGGADGLEDSCVSCNYRRLTGGTNNELFRHGLPENDERYNIGNQESWLSRKNIARLLGIDKKKTRRGFAGFSFGQNDVCNVCNFDLNRQPNIAKRFNKKVDKRQMNRLLALRNLQEQMMLGRSGLNEYGQYVNSNNIPDMNYDFPGNRNLIQMQQKNLMDQLNQQQMHDLIQTSNHYHSPVNNRHFHVFNHVQPAADVSVKRHRHARHHNHENCDNDNRRRTLIYKTHSTQCMTLKTQDQGTSCLADFSQAVELGYKLNLLPAAKLDKYRKLVNETSGKFRSPMTGREYSLKLEKVNYKSGFVQGDLPTLLEVDDKLEKMPKAEQYNSNLLEYKENNDKMINAICDAILLAKDIGAAGETGYKSISTVPSSSITINNAESMDIGIKSNHNMNDQIVYRTNTTVDRLQQLNGKSRRNSTSSEIIDLFIQSNPNNNIFTNKSALKNTSGDQLLKSAIFRSKNRLNSASSTCMNFSKIRNTTKMSSVEFKSFIMNDDMFRKATVKHSNRTLERYKSYQLTSQVKTSEVITRNPMENALEDYELMETNVPNFIQRNLSCFSNSISNTYSLIKILERNKEKLSGRSFDEEIENIVNYNSFITDNS